jgi:hypothetical protein
VAAPGLRPAKSHDGTDSLGRQEIAVREEVHLCYILPRKRDEVLMNEEQIRRCLDRIGQALSAGDLRGIADCWEVPALVLSDEGAITITEASEIESFFTRAVEWYRSQGLMATRPELERVEPLSEKLTAVDVRWPTFDAAGTEKASERSHYILRLGEDGQQRIQVALTRTRG